MRSEKHCQIFLTQPNNKKIKIEKEIQKKI